MNWQILCGFVPVPRMLRSWSIRITIAVILSSSQGPSAHAVELHDFTNISSAISHARSLAEKCSRSLCADDESAEVERLAANLIEARALLHLATDPLAELLDLNVTCAADNLNLCQLTEDQMDRMREAQSIQDALHFLGKSLLAVAQWSAFLQDYEKNLDKWSPEGENRFRSFLEHLKSHLSRTKELVTFFDYQTYDRYGLSEEEGNAAIAATMDETLRSLAFDSRLLATTIGEKGLRNPGVRRRSLALLAKIGEGLLKVDRLKRRIRMGELEANLETERMVVDGLIDEAREAAFKKNAALRLVEDIDDLLLRLDACHRKMSGGALTRVEAPELSLPETTGEATAFVTERIEAVAHALIDLAGSLKIRTEEDILVQLPKPVYRSDERIVAGYAVPACVPSDAVLLAVHAGNSPDRPSSDPAPLNRRPRGRVPILLADELTGTFVDDKGRVLTVSAETAAATTLWENMPRPGVDRLYSGTLRTGAPMPKLGEYSMLLYAPSNGKTYASRKFAVVAASSEQSTVSLSFVAERVEEVHDRLPLNVRREFVRRRPIFFLDMTARYGSDGDIVFDAEFQNHLVRWYKGRDDILEIQNKFLESSIFRRREDN